MSLSSPNGNLDLAARVQAHADARDSLYAQIDQAVAEAVNELEFERNTRPDLPEQPPIVYEPENDGLPTDSVEPAA